MPFVAVAAAAAGLAVSAGVAASTVAMVGVGASVIGKVTKSRELMQLGTGIGLGAGIASIASSVFGGTSAATVPNTISSSDLAGIDQAAGGIGGVAADPSELQGISTAWDQPARAATQGATAGLPPSNGLLSASSGTNNADVAALGNVPQPSMPAATAPSTSGNAPLSPPPATDTNSIAKWWSQQSEATKNRILQTGGSFAGGLFDGWSAEQKLAFDRERQNLEKQKYETAVANGNAQPVLRFQQYTPPPGTGLLAKRG